jgi:hypothetical protein
MLEDDMARWIAMTPRTISFTVAEIAKGTLQLVCLTVNVRNYIKHLLAQIAEILQTDCHIILVNWLAANVLAHV